MAVDEPQTQEPDVVPTGETEFYYHANPDFIIRKIAGEVLAVPVGATAHRLNATMILNEGGALLWEQLSSGSRSKADLVHALKEQYDVDAETALQDVSSFLEKAIAEGVVYQK